MINLRSLRDVVGWIRDQLRSESETEADVDIDHDRVQRLAAEAPDESVNEALLANETGATYHPLVTYLDEGEQPMYALPGGRLWMGAEGSSKADEIPSKQTVVLVTDERVLIVVGKQITDTLWQVPFESVTDLSIRYSDREAYLIVEADLEGVEESFYVELLDRADGDRYDKIVRYCRSRAAATNET